MAQGRRSNDPKTYILNFFYDDDDASALSARINDHRFHIIADPGRLRKSGGVANKVLKEYRTRLEALRQAALEETEDGEGSATTSDSGVDVDGEDDKEQKTAPPLTNSADSAIDVKQDHASLETDLGNWIMSCFADEVARVASVPKELAQVHMFDWYSAPAHFYEIEVQDDVLMPVVLEETEDLQHRLVELLPCLHLPKYIKNLGLPMIDPSEITVLESSDFIDPIHPSRVLYKEEEYFFKPVDPSQPGPSKREITSLHRISKLGLQDQINVPQIHGLVSSSPGEKSSIMGMLLTFIDDPTPLTKLMNSDVSEAKRHKWANESERIVGLLHEHDIIWGDAKGDNFIVDKDDKLWIIDFGGSYTEGWIDPEMVETEEGDDAALEKVVNALHDPDGNTFDPEEEIAAPDAGSGSRSGRKRKASGSRGHKGNDSDGENNRGQKRSRH